MILNQKKKKNTKQLDWKSNVANYNAADSLFIRKIFENIGMECVQYTQDELQIGCRNILFFDFLSTYHDLS